MKVLFISHDASRTGAPICLLHLLLWLKENTDLKFEILLRNAGPLRPEFEKLGPVLIYRRPLAIKLLIKQRRLLGGIKEWLGQRRELFKLRRSSVRTFDDAGLVEHIRKLNPALIYSNTVVNGDLLRILSPLGSPVISHIHELQNIIDQFGRENWQAVKASTHRFIAASPAVKRNLTENCAVSPDMVGVVYESIPTKDVIASPSRSAGIRQSLGIGPEKFVVCGSGLDEWRKGTDLFIRCAQVAQKNCTTSLAFIWVGGWLSEAARLEHLRLAEELGVSGIVHFTGMVENPLDYFSLADAFALTSREDPFPLVCLEAASLGKPVLCFAESGGMPDFVEDDAGFVVPQEDFEAMAIKIAQLASSPNLARLMGERAKTKVRDRHDIDIGARQILRIIQQQLIENTGA